MIRKWFWRCGFCKSKTEISADQARELLENKKIDGLESICQCKHFSYASSIIVKEVNE